MITSGAKRLIAIQAVMNAAQSLAGSFSLIYLVDRGFSYQESLVFLLAALGLTTVLTVVISARGVLHSRFSIFMSSLFLAGCYGSFLFLEGWWLLLVPGVFYGLQITFFWIPLNVLLLKQTKSSNRGFTLGVSFFIYPLIGVVMPVLGGSIIEGMDFYTVFIIACGILVTNAIIVATARFPAGRIGMRLKNMRSRLSLGFFMEGLQEGVWFFSVPLLTYEFATGEFRTGLLFSFFALIGTLASVVIAKVSDKKKKRLVYAKIGAVGAIPGMFIAGFAPDLTIFIIGMALFNFFIPMVSIFMMTQAGDVGWKKEGNAMLTREFMLNSGRSITIIASIFILASCGIGPIFAASGLFLLGILLVK